MSKITERYKELSNKYHGGEDIPHRDAAILTLAETIERLFKEVTYATSSGRTLDIYDNSREN